MTTAFSKVVLLQAPGFLGDEVVFTGVVRELKRETGWNFRVKTNRPELWAHNRNIEGVGAQGNEDVVLELDYCPTYHQMSQAPLHYLEQYLKNIREVLGLRTPYQVSKFGGQVVPNGKEMRSRPFGLPPRYWLVVAGWKPGVPTKAWPTAFYQEVVDTLRGRVCFVQTGSRTNWHPSLKKVVNVVGQTTLRQLIRLIYHAEGVLCPITSIMHLAAAIPVSPASGFSIRPCVVVAGGRESPHYINYPMHRVISTVGQLDCCASSACGKAHFGPGHCPLPTPVLSEMVPKCMTLIQPADVVSAIDFFYRGQISIPPRIGRVEALSRRLLGVTSTSAGEGVIKGVIAGDLRGKISSQLLLGHTDLHLIVIKALQNTFSSPAVPGRRPLSVRALKEAQAQATSATEFARSRCQLFNESEGETVNREERNLFFVFWEAQHESEIQAGALNVWSDRVIPGGFLGGTCYNKDTVCRLVNQFASSKKLKVVADKNNTWFIEFPRTDEGSDHHTTSLPSLRQGFNPRHQ